MKLSYLLDLPKTLYFNLKCFDFRTALKLPVFIHHRTKFYSVSGKVKISGNISRGMIKIGYPYVSIFSFNIPTIIEIFGEIEFKGIASIGHGC
jgi:hypothetical protein